MAPTMKRLNSVTGTVALVLALLALVAAAAGVGYAAGQIGTNGIQDNAVTADKIAKNAVTAKKIKKNAVTSKKVKDGSLKPADLAPQEAQHQPVLANGGEGDCLWRPATVEIPSSGPPTYRLDRDGRVILSGIALGADAVGGDGDCDASAPGQASDGIAFILPAGYVPAKTQYLVSVAGELIIAGPQGFIGPGVALPPGAVFGDGGVLLDGVEFDPVGSKVVLARTKASGRWTGALL